ncbi:hypothetical protein [Streptomyces sp. NPDC014793]|uniref:hypothetical protein n=1 Tax=Streptomyces sp. NPDC014793 TaxID=3364914 RepID=UPI0036F55529
MTAPLPDDEIIYDHIDGEIVGPMPFHSGEEMGALLLKRMTPENLDALAEHMAARAAENIEQRNQGA